MIGEHSEVDTPTLAAGPFCWHVMAGACVDLTFIVKHCVSMFADAAEGKVRTFADCLREGLVEYLDVNEQNDCLIALDHER
jgi:hypothetical protein